MKVFNTFYYIVFVDIVCKRIKAYFKIGLEKCYFIESGLITKVDNILKIT